MKEYIIESLKRIKTFSKKLDAETILYNKKYWLFNDENEKQFISFHPGNKLRLIRNGEVTNGRWEIDAHDMTLLVEFDRISYLYKPAFIDNKLLILQLYGTEKNVVMIEEANKENFKPNSIKELNEYFEDFEKRKIEETQKGLLCGDQYTDKIFIKRYNTKKGSIEIHTKFDSGYSIGDLVLLDNEKAPDGKYVLGWTSFFDYIIVKDSRIEYIC